MNASIWTIVVPAFVAGVVSVIVTLLTHIFGSRRDRAAEWRKVKLDHYREYAAALSGTVHNPKNEAVQRRYSDAFNTMGLIAPPPVLNALYKLQDEIRISNQQRSPQGYDRLYSELLRHMRIDCQPSAPTDPTGFIFLTINAGEFSA